MLESESMPDFAKIVYMLLGSLMFEAAVAGGDLDLSSLPMTS